MRRFIRAKKRRFSHSTTTFCTTELLRKWHQNKISMRTLRRGIKEFLNSHLSVWPLLMPSRYVHTNMFLYLYSYLYLFWSSFLLDSACFLLYPFICLRQFFHFFSRILIFFMKGYGYDAGLRVGDRLVSVGGVDATKMNVEQVNSSSNRDCPGDCI